MAGIELDDTAGPAGELALPPRRGAPVLSADEVRRAHRRTRKPLTSLAADVMSSAAMGVQPFVAVPHDGHGPDGFEPDVGVVAVDQGEKAALDYRRAAGPAVPLEEPTANSPSLTPDRLLSHRT